MRETDKHYFFWRHQFGQWTMRTMVDVDGTEYNCAEQFMMAKKAALFGDELYLSLIMSSTDPAQQQAFGRKVRNFDPARWKRYRYKIVCQANYLKFSQHQDLLTRLLATQDKELVESSPKDCVWGVGLAASDERILDPQNWRGENLLGKALMAVRESLRDSRFAENLQQQSAPLALV